jgi:hypothetical protein
MGKHIPHAIHPHGTAYIQTPFLKQMTGIAIRIGERLPVISTSNSGADFCHFH